MPRMSTRSCALLASGCRANASAQISAQAKTQLALAATESHRYETLAGSGVASHKYMEEHKYKAPTPTERAFSGEKPRNRVA